MQPVESEGKTVAEAVDAALHRMGLRRDQVEVYILQEPSSGFMGLGAKPAKVRVTEKLWGEGAKSESGEPLAAPRRGRKEEPEEEGVEFPPDEKSDFPPRENEREHGRREPREERGRRAPAPGRAPHRAPAGRTPTAGARPPRPEREEKPADPEVAAKKAAEVLHELIGLMGLSCKLGGEVTWDPKQERVRVALEGDDAAKLVGQDGRGLEALQFIVTLITSRKSGGSAAVQIDALGYWQKREDEILSKARRGIDEVKRTGKSVRLEPMDASMRRLIHRNLADHPDVETVSEGEGSWRKIVLRPRKK